MNLYITKHIKLSYNHVAEMTDSYHSLQINYPKFFKMDNLSKLGILASERIFKNEKKNSLPREDIAIIGFNRSASLEVDSRYQETIQHVDNYFPSPSIFVYTLPNIVLGEIAIRYNFLGETAFYVCEKFDADLIVSMVSDSFWDDATNAVLLCWVESFEEKHEVLMLLIEQTSENALVFNQEEVIKLYN